MPPKHHGNKKKGFFGNGKKYLTDFDSIQGILFTCNSSRQREASQEALGLVEQFGDKLVETIDTLQNDILEIMTKEREKQIIASKKKQDRINARISREKQSTPTQSSVAVPQSSSSTVVDETIVQEQNSENKLLPNNNSTTTTTTGDEQKLSVVEEKKIEEQSASGLTTNSSESNQATSSDMVNLSTTVPSPVPIPSLIDNSSNTDNSSNSTIASCTNNSSETNKEVEEKQNLTTWQLKERNQPAAESALNLSTILSCEYLETEVKIVKDGSKNYELLETGVGGQLFVRIRNRAISPVALCQKISKHFKKAYDSQEEISSRFLFKMFPICDMFQANENNLNNRFTKLVDNKFDKTKAVKYVVNIKSHHNNTLDKKVIYETIAHKMPNGTVELNNAGVEFHVFLMKGKCLLGMSTECDIFNYNINAMRHTTTQDEIMKENQRNASKRKANELLTESSLEVADMIEVEKTSNNDEAGEDEPMEDVNSTLEQSENSTTKLNTTDSQITSQQPTSSSEECNEPYEFLEEPIPMPFTEATVSLQVYSKRRKVQNHPSVDFDDIKVI